MFRQKPFSIVAAVVLAALVLASAARAEDWPTLQKDIRRTGFTPDEPRPPYTAKWAFQVTNDTFHSSVQPIIANGRVFAGTLGGRFYSVSAEDGSFLWSFETEGPIFATATAEGDKVFFGSHDGRLYALDAATGKQGWAHDAGSAIWACPLVMDGLVMVGTRGGEFIAVRADTGETAWSIPVGAPALQSAASDGTVVYFGAEDIRFRAVDVKTGKLLWTSPQYEGCRFRFTWPVVADGKVYTPMTGVEDFWIACTRDGAGLGKSWSYKIDRPTHAEGYQETVIKYLTANPDRQPIYILDAADGKKVGVPPMFLINGGGPPHPAPIVLGDGSVLAAYGGIEFGETDPAFIGKIVFTDAGVRAEELVSTRFVGTATPDMQGFIRMFPADIPFAMSCGGRMLFGISGATGAYDLVEKKHYNFPGAQVRGARTITAPDPPSRPLAGGGSNCASPFALSGNCVYGIRSGRGGESITCVEGASQ
jgi:hypothetical protein